MLLNALVRSPPPHGSRLQTKQTKRAQAGKNPGPGAQAAQATALGFVLLIAAPLFAHGTPRSAPLLAPGGVRH